MNDIIIHDIKDGDAKFWKKMKPGDFAVFSIATYAKYAQVRGSAYRVPRCVGGIGGPKYVARKTRDKGKGFYPTHCVISCHDSARDLETVTRVEFEVEMIRARVEAYLDTLVIAELVDVTAAIGEPKGLLKAKPAEAVVDKPVLELVG